MAEAEPAPEDSSEDDEDQDDEDEEDDCQVVGDENLYLHQKFSTLEEVKHHLFDYSKKHNFTIVFKSELSVRIPEACVLIQARI